ncbi:hypothetical protein [Mycolicibacterium parafortuitum]|uniref:Uncharacterized protein n=1 Tax=Mycolicibacterium parafortuitum TaxID=39692 RepID=A0A375YJL6_MYCPF|nr:hypothetical protein [Mycolicibacterium parafortuitum]SRX81336.1 hypothetical protein MPP7335_03085 [Mycolicibacterium parafortuitum]
MTMFEVDDLESSENKGSGVRSSGETLHAYDLTVVADDVGAVVAAAGGWLCDRVRAGWQVTVLVPAEADVRPLTILGVRCEAVTPSESAPDLVRRSCAAVAVDGQLVRRDARMRRELHRLLEAGRTEITVWGDVSGVGTDDRFERVWHRASAAARAFKAGALRAIGQPGPEATVETFVSAALWYPLDGADLLPVAGR